MQYNVTADFNPRQWYAIGMNINYNASDNGFYPTYVQIYVNGSNRLNITGDLYHTSTKNWIMGGTETGTVSDNQAGALFDHYKLYEGFCDPQDFVNFADTSPTTISDTASASFELRTRDNLNITASLLENIAFNIKVNFSIDGASVSTGNCSFSGGNMSSFFYLNSSANVSLIGNNDVSMNISAQALHVLAGIISDKYSFRVCREGTQPNIAVTYINGAFFKNVSTADIPPCSAGFHDETVTTTSFITGTSFNISVRCPSCSVGQQLRIIRYGQFNDLLNVLRIYDPHHQEDLIYDSATKFYYPDDFHTYPNAQTINVSVQCTNLTLGANSTRQYVVGDTIPISKIETLTDSSGERNFIDGMTAESGNITIQGNCFNDTIIYKQINVTYTNLTLVASSLEYFIDLPSALLAEDTNYNVTLRCIDDEGNTTISKGWFTLTDTTMPVITWVYPSEDNTSSLYQNQTLTIDVTASDFNLFSVEVTCKDSLGVVKYSNYSENLSQVFQVIGTSSMITNLGQGECNVTVKDKHTDNDITDKNIIEMQDKDRLSFIYGDVKLNITASGFSPDSFITKKEIDRITFYPKVSTIPSELTYYTDCENGALLYYDDKVYDGKNKFGKYFNCGDLWID
jgi:hypothetical protein